MKKFDRFVIVFLGSLLFLILLLVLRGDRVGIKVLEFFPSEGEQVSAFGPVGFRFAQEMDQRSVEENFVIDPPVEGSFIWEEDKVWFYPRQVLDLGLPYQVRLLAGTRADDGRELLETLVWTVEARSPEILYLELDELGGDLMVLNRQNKSITPLTQTEGAVIDFSPSPTGAFIAYMAVNSMGGSDLWLVSRDGQTSTQLVDCTQDNCSQPNWRMGEEIIAYVREAFDPTSQQNQPGQIWTVNIRTGDTSLLYPSGQVFSHSPAFSPDGEKLAAYDITQEAIRVLDLASSEEFLIPTAIDRMGHWSADSQAMIFTDLVLSVLEPEIMIYQADLGDRSITEVFPLLESTDFSQPQWSPDGEWIAVGLRPTNMPISRALWLLNLDGTESFAIVDQPTATFSAYRWDAWGERLVYQRLALGSSVPLTSIWVWDWESRRSELLVENGVRPEWLY